MSIRAIPIISMDELPARSSRIRMTKPMTVDSSNILLSSQDFTKGGMGKSFLGGAGAPYCYRPYCVLSSDRPLGLYSPMALKCQPSASRDNSPNVRDLASG